ncbi:sodium:solute symporter family protein [Roseateles sp. BYS180W]|uniref:Sodium:solute symporter family protein n=1 Tax=Roseateles rivi TaxID=3299028 RepID=A0ABW7FV07_9BURK
MHTFDWMIIAGFVLASVGLSLWRGRHAGKSVGEFFIAGRSLGWFMAGTSMVATTFSSDTPLFVAGAVRQDGIYANWIWWSSALATLASIFFFANLWRRSEVTTEVELIHLRYTRSPASNALRLFKAVLDGVVINAMIMASVTFAAMKVATAIMGLSSTPQFTLPLLGSVTPVMLVIAVLGTVAVAYSTVTGFNGVVYSDAMQFGLAMLGAMVLAVVTWLDVTQQGPFAEVVLAAAHDKPKLLHIFPEVEASLPFATFVILITVSWLPLAPGTGYFLQRVLASKTERDAVLGFSWFAFCHYVLRSWPWILVGAASVVYFPALTDAESSYPLMINHMLPWGLKGLMVASLLAAFMSCITSQLNWGSSYIVNDIYKPYVAPGKAERHYVRAARLSMLGLALVTALIIPSLQSILGVYKYLGVVATGSAVALIGRWYWWRINVWSEITGAVSGVVVGSLLFVICPDSPGQDLFAIRLLLNLLICSVLTLAVAYFSSPAEPDAQCQAFYKQVRPPGPGWERVRRMPGMPASPDHLRGAAGRWVAAAALLYGALLFPGFALLGQWPAAAAWLALAGLGGFTLWRLHTAPRVPAPGHVTEPSH